MAIKTISAPMMKYIKKVLPEGSLYSAIIVNDHLVVTLNDGWVFPGIGDTMRVFFVREAKNILLTAQQKPQHIEGV